jgi:crotonobetaine/carnitine-CoA ligase
MTARPSTANGTTNGHDNITAMLSERAQSHSGAVFLRTSDGDLTYEQTHTAVGRLAGALAGIGVRAGTTVAVVMRNSAEQVVVWFALARLGAVHVPINHGLKRDLLAHAVRVADPRIVVADEPLLGQICGVVEETQSVTAIVVHRIAGTAPTAVGCSAYDLRDLMAADENNRPAHVGGDLDDATMLFTSGTTGPSKACVLSHRYLARQGQIHAERFGIGSDDVLYCPFPLYHVDAATLTVVAALAVGATAAIGTRFSASRFWDEIRAFDASVFNFMGATLTLLWKRDPSPEDRAHRVRLAWGVPMPDWQKQFELRFGFPLYQVYGLTDAGVPVYDPIDGLQRPGACGRVIDQFEVRIASDGDQPDRERPPAAVGEILVRGREPGLTITRYHGMPDATARTIDSDGWVHTGDLGRMDADGYLTFLGRSSDSIRRRGENISAFELEQIVETHPAVLEAAAIGVPSEFTEEDVKVYVVLKAGIDLTPEALYRYCCANAARFMVPRYIEFIDSLPKTSTQKVEKFRLKQLGVTESTWNDDAIRGRGWSSEGI